MSIDKTGVKYRVSNVLAWGGYIGFILLIIGIAMTIVEMNNGRRVPWEPFLEEMLWGLGAYLGCALINYLMVGKMRLLPWKDIE